MGEERSVAQVRVPSPQKYYAMRDEVVRVERELLVAFGFVMHVEHPHKHVMNYLSVMSRDKEGYDPLKDGDQAALKGLMQTAVNYVNDSLRTTLCVRFKADTVACAAIFLAARHLKVVTPPQRSSSIAAPHPDLFRARGCPLEQTSSKPLPLPPRFLLFLTGFESPPLPPQRHVPR